MTTRLAQLTFLVTVVAFGQDSQLSGLIQDPSEAVVVDAEITLRNDGTGSRRIARSSTGGLYTLTTLKPGVYRMTVRAAGFETLVREGIELQVGENARLDFTLRIGDSQTTITVNGGPPLVNQEDASVGTVIDRKLIDRMPLNGRGIQTLIQLAPGVTQIPVVDASRGQFVINGQRTDANYFTVDGVSANFAAGNAPSLNGGARQSGLETIGQAGGGMLPANNFLGTFSNLLSPNALQEFKIQTSTYAPEFGHLPGGQIDLLSRSGAKRFSGSLFEYFRNDKTDANDWFLNAAGAPRNKLRFHNFGATLSGPLHIPHLYRGDGQTFFFLSIDTLIARQPLPSTRISVPSLAARQGASPALAALLNGYPLPNAAPDPLQDAAGMAGYVGSETRRYDQHAYSLRVDRNFADRVSFFTRYNHAPSHRSEPNQFAGTPSNFEHYDIGTETLTGGLTHVITANLVHELRGNFSQISNRDSADIDSRAGAQAPPASTLLPPGYSLSDSSLQYIVDGSLIVYMGTFGRNRGRQFQATDNLTWVRGAHRLRIGVDYRRFQVRRQQPKLQGTTALAIYNEDGSFASDSLGWLARTNFDNDIEYLVPSFSAYAQDTWRINRSLTITWGLRWELAPAPRTIRGAAQVFGGLTDLKDPSNTYLLSPGQPFYPTSWNNVAPRIGLGWQLFENAGKPTVLRAGFGRFFSTAQAGFQDNPRDHQIFALYGPSALGHYPNGQSLASETPTDNLRAIAATHGYNLPSTYQWNVTLEQAIGQQTVSLGYVGALGRGLIGDANLPQAAHGRYVQILGNNASSSYHAMQLQWNRRFSRRVQILASYTWSHSIDNLSNDISPAYPGRSLNAYLNPDANRGPSDFDVRHSLNGAVLIELPSPHRRGFATLLKDWSANTIFFARSALPTDLVSLQGDPHGIDHIAGEPFYLYGPQYPGGKGYNRDAFVALKPGQHGNLGRNALRGFNAWQIDFALHRQIRLTERLNVELRAEAFNVLNHANFANPADLGAFNTLMLIKTSGFGIATAMLANGLSSTLIPGELNPLFQIGAPRVLQFALRLNF